MGIGILKILEKHSREDSIVKTMSEDKAFTDNEDIRAQLWDLESLGLAEKISAKDYYDTQRRGGNRMVRNPVNVYLYKRTKLGDGLYNFIVKGIPN